MQRCNEIATAANDERFMRRAIELAREGDLKPGGNPIGSIWAKIGRIVYGAERDQGASEVFRGPASRHDGFHPRRVPEGS